MTPAGIQDRSECWFMKLRDHDESDQKADGRYQPLDVVSAAAMYRMLSRRLAIRLVPRSGYPEGGNPLSFRDRPEPAQGIEFRPDHSETTADPRSMITSFSPSSPTRKPKT